MPKLRFNYGPVEITLAVIYAATEADKRRKAFRACINYFQRAKVLGDDVEGRQAQAKCLQHRSDRAVACLPGTDRVGGATEVTT